MTSESWAERTASTFSTMNQLMMVMILLLGLMFSRDEYDGKIILRNEAWPLGRYAPILSRGISLFIYLGFSFLVTLIVLFSIVGFLAQEKAPELVRKEKAKIENVKEGYLLTLSESIKADSRILLRGDIVDLTGAPITDRNQENVTVGELEYQYVNKEIQSEIYKFTIKARRDQMLPEEVGTWSYLLISPFINESRDMIYAIQSINIMTYHQPFWGSVFHALPGMMLGWLICAGFVGALSRVISLQMGILTAAAWWLFSRYFLFFGETTFSEYIEQSNDKKLWWESLFEKWTKAFLDLENIHMFFKEQDFLSRFAQGFYVEAPWMGKGPLIWGISFLALLATILLSPFLRRTI